MAGKPVLFPLNITSGETVLMIKWDLYPRNGTPFELAVLRNGQLRTSNLKDMDRLDVLNETTLRIKALQENETGVLKSRVTYTTSEMEIFEFNLTVSVPAPESNPPDVPSVSQSEGLVSSREQKTPTIQLKRILGESALLPVHITSANTVSIVKWIFHPRQGEANDLGRFSDGKWKRWNTSDSLGQRLEMVDGTTLKISNLVVKDSGNYTAHVTFSTGVIESHTFNLTVYEPVQEPQVTHKLISNTPDGCNVTLRCQASGKGDLRVSWKRGNPLRALGECLGWHQLSDNGKDLHLFWHRNASDTNITCLVSNPADQKNISINLLSLCPAEAQQASSACALVSKGLSEQEGLSLLAEGDQRGSQSKLLLGHHQL
ncbi:uncharacterized protein LOC128404415 isoform X2 [Podarcis raffonei]|uniref:uncharacterized protein LOC128404415 isoform X2 n=1 Tax=Podarcis raffonei TaxID=65483 RepID=UPI00232945D1|nr:uncharacterized protein LOC128404415 isoform X2 [Podarcis raffonei]